MLQKDKNQDFTFFWGTKEEKNKSRLNFIESFNNSCYILIYLQDIIRRSSCIWAKGHYDLHDVKLEAVLSVSLSINLIYARQNTWKKIVIKGNIWTYTFFKPFRARKMVQ